MKDGTAATDNYLSINLVGPDGKVRRLRRRKRPPTAASVAKAKRDMAEGRAWVATATLFRKISKQLGPKTAKLIFREAIRDPFPVNRRELRDRTLLAFYDGQGPTKSIPRLYQLVQFLIRALPNAELGNRPFQSLQAFERHMSRLFKRRRVQE